VSAAGVQSYGTVGLVFFGTNWGFQFIGALEFYGQLKRHCLPVHVYHCWYCPYTLLSDEGDIQHQTNRFFLNKRYQIPSQEIKRSKMISSIFMPETIPETMLEECFGISTLSFCIPPWSRVQP